jgi:hypothetical protein
MQPGLVLVGLAVIAIAFVLLPVAAATYAWLRSPRRLRCPELARDTAVAVEARHGAWTSLLGLTHLRVARCARWPERGDCAQGCLAGIPGTTRAVRS